MRSHPIVRTGLLALVLFAAPLLQPRPVPAASAGPGVTVTTFATGLDNPHGMKFGPGCLRLSRSSVRVAGVYDDREFSCGSGRGQHRARRAIGCDDADRERARLPGIDHVRARWRSVRHEQWVRTGFERQRIDPQNPDRKLAGRQPAGGRPV